MDHTGVGLGKTRHSGPHRLGAFFQLHGVTASRCCGKTDRKFFLLGRRNQVLALQRDRVDRG